jgi:glucose-6-phosphate 1-dehydrogenase
MNTSPSAVAALNATLRDWMSEPAIFIILGATGDLAEKKLFTALYRNFVGGLMPEKFAIVGFARRPFTDEAFQTLVLDGLEAVLGSAEAGEYMQRIAFVKRISYQQGFFDDTNAYTELAAKLAAIDKNFGTCSHKLFHLSVPPFWYEKVLTCMDTSGLTISCVDGPGMTRVLIEKPIGSDLPSSQRVNDILEKMFTPEQVFRIDHYLMKDSLYNLLLVYRSGFDPIRPEDCERVELRFFEKRDNEGRGSFYDSVGALRDVGQNHMLESLALLMTAKLEPEAELVAVRARAIESLTVVSNKKDADLYARGQYEGYVKEDGVMNTSQTETYFRFPLRSNLPEWSAVDISLASGKALNESITEIRIILRKEQLFTVGRLVQQRVADRVYIEIQPNPRIRYFWGNKEVGVILENEMREVLSEDTIVSPMSSQGYERVYVDALLDKHERFVSRKEIEASWKVIDAVRREIEAKPLVVYKKGSTPF